MNRIRKSPVSNYLRSRSLFLITYLDISSDMDGNELQKPIWCKALFHSSDYFSWNSTSYFLRGPVLLAEAHLLVELSEHPGRGFKIVERHTAGNRQDARRAEGREIQPGQIDSVKISFLAFASLSTLVSFSLIDSPDPFREFAWHNALPTYFTSR